MDSYGGLPAQLVHLQNPFLHPALEARLPFGSAGAFRPVVTSAASSTSTSSSGGGGDERMSVKGLPSAFSTPNLSNRRKLESEIEQHHQQSNRSRGSGGGGGGGGSQQDDRNSFVAPSAISVGVINLDKSSTSANSVNYMNGGQSKHRSCSPASNHPVNCSPSSSSGREKQQQQEDRDDYHGGTDDRDGNGTPNSDMTDRSTPEDTHLSKRKAEIYAPLISFAFLGMREKVSLTVCLCAQYIHIYRHSQKFPRVSFISLRIGLPLTSPPDDSVNLLSLSHVNVLSFLCY